MQRYVVRWFAKCGVLPQLRRCWPAGLRRPGSATACSCRDDHPRRRAGHHNRYAREPIPDVVLVGSSLTFRLKEEYFATPRLRNLALAGGSPVTGLEIVASQARLPKIILVETNVLSRTTDTSRGREICGRRCRSAVSSADQDRYRRLRNWNHAPLNHAQAALSSWPIAHAPPSDFDNRIYLDARCSRRTRRIPRPRHRNVKRIAELIATLEQRGAQVLLFEIPCSGPTEQSRSARITREIVRARFPDSDRWLRVVFPGGELRWPDGLHLDERSAVIMAHSIDQALSSLPGKK